MHEVSHVWSSNTVTFIHVIPVPESRVSFSVPVFFVNGQLILLRMSALIARRM